MIRGRTVSLPLVALIALGCGGGDPSGEDAGGVDSGALEDAGRDTAVERCRAASDCDDGAWCTGEEVCNPDDPTAGPDGCLAGTPPCEGSTRCVEEEVRCETICPDLDGDGRRDLSCGGDDCDDSDANRFPGNPEVCDPDDHDEDCDSTTFGVRDSDGDGAPDASCCNLDGAGVAACGNDCDDANGTVHPTATEACNDRDDDCDGAVDEEVGMTFLRDDDGDDFGVTGDTVEACTAEAPYTATAGGDCDDSMVGVFPGATEVCNGADDDCDGMMDEGLMVTYYRDADGDGHGDSGMTTLACADADGWVTDNSDCDDNDARSFPGASEICDGRDNDCSEGGGPAVSEDADGDGHGPAGAPCLTVVGSIPLDDCRDDIASVNPGNFAFATEAACPSGLSPCFMFNGIWTCTPGDIGCPGPEVTQRTVCVGPEVECAPDNIVWGVQIQPQWDMNCDGTVEPMRRQGGCGSACGECRGSGPGTGPTTDYTSMSDPPCGELVEHKRCFCFMAGFCNSELFDQALACR